MQLSNKLAHVREGTGILIKIKEKTHQHRFTSALRSLKGLFLDGTRWSLGDVLRYY